MLSWLKNNLAMMKNGLPVLCESCPCMELVYPSIYEYFPFWLGLGDYSIGWTNAGWEKLTIYEYDPDTDLWIDPPYFECAGENDARAVYYFGFTQALWASCTGRDEFATGAKRICVPGVSECPPPPYYFNVFSRYGINPKDRHELRFDFSDLPEKLAGTGDAQALQIKPGHKYTFKAYDITESPEELLFEGKIVVEFPAFELHISDVENPAVDYYAYAINYGDYPYAYKSRTTPFSVYDMDDNLVFSSYGWNEIAQVNALGCLEDINYSVLAKCSFSGQDCSGCLKDVEFQVTTDFMASRLAGDCKNITNIERKGSYKYTLVASGFDTRAEAENYLDENHDGLYAQMKSQCAGGSWYIIGICECNDDTCEQCTMVDGSITIKCEDEIEDCFEDGGTYYKHTKLADRKTFSDYMSAIEYLTENFDDLEDELGELCSPCEDVTLAMTISWFGNPAAAGIWTRTVDGILEIDLMGHWWRNGQKIIECTGVNYNEYSNGWEISAGGFSGCIRFSSSYTRMEWEVGDYEDWYMTSSFYNIFRDGYWETAAMDSYVTQYNGHTHSTICSEYHSCHEGPLGCDNGVSHNGIHCVAINSKNLDGSGSVQNVFNGGGNSIVCTVNMSYSLTGASR